MHIVVAAKQVLDPEGINSYALWGKLAIDESGRGFTVGDVIPRIINAYDEQAMEAALRIRDSGVSCTITAVSVGSETNADVLKRCLALGAETAILVNDPEAGRQDGFRTAALIAQVVRQLGDVDVVICGRQGSDYDQGVVPGALAEFLDWALVTLASGVEASGSALRISHVTPAGIEEVEADLPAVVSVSNEIGLARFPTSRGMLEARRKRPTIYEASALLDGNPQGRVQLARITVPDVQGHCEFIAGDSPNATVSNLFKKLDSAGVLRG
jgi:electron transfer flavoprotein beta subunit